MVMGCGTVTRSPAASERNVSLVALGLAPENADGRIHCLGDDRTAGEHPAAAHRRDKRIELAGIGQ